MFCEFVTVSGASSSAQTNKIINKEGSTSSIQRNTSRFQSWYYTGCPLELVYYTGYPLELVYYTGCPLELVLYRLPERMYAMFLFPHLPTVEITVPVFSPKLQTRDVSKTRGEQLCQSFLPNYGLLMSPKREVNSCASQNLASGVNSHETGYNLASPHVLPSLLQTGQR